MNEKILVADDDEAIRETIQYLLEDKGYNVITADTVLRAKEMLYLYKPDMVIVDYRFAESTGSELVQHIRNSITNKNVPVIVISSDQTVSRYLQKMGADDFVEKPFDFDTLFGKINKYSRNKI